MLKTSPCALGNPIEIILWPQSFSVIELSCLWHRLLFCCHTSKDLGSEHELCQVYLGNVGESVRANTHEIADIRYVSAGALATEMDVSPERFTPWFKMEWQTLLTEHKGMLANYCGD